MSADTEALLATVRQNLQHSHGMYVDCKPCVPHAALDSLAAELEQLRGLIEDNRRLALGAALDDAQRELERVKAERDAQQRRIEDLEEQAWPWEWVIATRERERWKVAETRLDRALAALREIKKLPSLKLSKAVVRICDEAIAEIEGEK